MRNAYSILALGVIVLYAPITAEASVALGNISTNSLSNGLVGYWPLDGDTTNWTTGITQDISGQGNNGQLIAMSTSTSPVQGKIGQALNFKSASSQYVNITSAATVSPSGNTLTISAWVKRATSSATGAILNKNGAYAFDIGVSPCTGSQVKLTKYNVVDICIGTFPSDTKYHYLTAVWSNSGVALYIDGILNATSSNTSNFATTVSPLTIGYDSGDNTYFNGAIDDVRIYNRALSTQEVASLYAAGSVNADHSTSSAGGLTSGLVGYWPLDGSTINWATNTFSDASGSGNNATSTGMSTSSSPASGKIGQALKFNGSSQYLSIPNSSSINLSSAVTISAWVYPSAFAGLNGIVSKYNSNGGNEYFLRLSGSSPYNTLDCGGSADFSGTATLSLNKWQLVTCTISGTTGKLYINGALDTTGTVGISPGNDPVTIGSDFLPGKRVWSGKIDDVRIYNRTLSAQEVTQLYVQGQVDVAHSNASSAVGINTGLVGYWTFDGSATNWTAGTTADASGGSTPATLNSFSKTASPTPGKIGQAFKFNGSSQYISHSHISAFDFGTGDFSVAFWIKPGTSWSGTTRGIIGQKSNDSSPGWQIYHDSNDSNSLRFRLGDASSDGSDLMGVAVSPSVWTYVVVERKSGVLYGYANGVPSGTSVSNTKNVSGGSANFNIGYADTWTAYYQGSLDDVRVYKRALTGQEVAQLYAMSK